MTALTLVLRGSNIRRHNQASAKRLRIAKRRLDSIEHLNRYENSSYATPLHKDIDARRRRRYDAFELTALGCRQ